MISFRVRMCTTLSGRARQPRSAFTDTNKMPSMVRVEATRWSHYPLSILVKFMKNRPSPC